jgi:hypothetical protein
MKSDTLDEKALRDENARAQEALRISELPVEGAKARYLQKPYSPTTLRRLVRETLDQYRAESRTQGSKAKSRP